jgi:hypothetical protein
MTLHDAAGASIASSIMSMPPRTFLTATSVVINGLTFDWHMTNRDNHLALSTGDPADTLTTCWQVLTDGAGPDRAPIAAAPASAPAASPVLRKPVRQAA